LTIIGNNVGMKISTLFVKDLFSFHRTVMKNIITRYGFLKQNRIHRIVLITQLDLTTVTEIKEKKV